MHIARLVSHGDTFESASDLFEFLACFPLYFFIHPFSVVPICP